MFRWLESFLHTLQLYGAAGIVAFGWAMCALLGWRAGPWMPLWFCSALLIYNVDRLRRDPADLLNTPLRAAASERLRRASLAVAAVAGAVLVALPVWRRDWLTLALVVGGALVSVQYSVPLLGFRLKDIPLLKSFFAPTMVVAAVFGLPWLHEGARPGALLAVVWAWGYLEFNMILCDLRDLEGDRRCGVLTLPVRLGEKRTRWVLKTIRVAYGLFALAGLATGDWKQHPFPWLVALAAQTYLSLLIRLSERPRSERFYEWAVEGMLFLPAVVVAFLQSAR